VLFQLDQQLLKPSALPGWECILRRKVYFLRGETWTRKEGQQVGGRGGTEGNMQQRVAHITTPKPKTPLCRHLCRTPNPSLKDGQTGERERWRERERERELLPSRRGRGALGERAREAPRQGIRIMKRGRGSGLRKQEVCMKTGGGTGATRASRRAGATV
jgi:hypothetical protein